MNPPLPAQPVTIGPAPAPRPENAAPPADDGLAAETAERIRESLRGVIDPDLGINIVDLGFIRGIQVRGRRAELRMTLTNRFCPLNSVFEDQMRTALVGGGVLDDVTVEWVFEPPWTPDEISDEARRQLREIGFAGM